MIAAQTCRLDGKELAQLLEVLEFVQIGFKAWDGARASEIDESEPARWPEIDARYDGNALFNRWSELHAAIDRLGDTIVLARRGVSDRTALPTPEAGLNKCHEDLRRLFEQFEAAIEAAREEMRA